MQDSYSADVTQFPKSTLKVGNFTKHFLNDQKPKKHDPWKRIE